MKLLSSVEKSWEQVRIYFFTIQAVIFELFLYQIYARKVFGIREKSLCHNAIARITAAEFGKLAVNRHVINVNLQRSMFTNKHSPPLPGKRRIDRERVGSGIIVFNIKACDKARYLKKGHQCVLLLFGVTSHRS